MFTRLLNMLALSALFSHNPLVFASKLNFDLDMSAEFNSILIPRSATNLQTFTGNLGGVSAPAITNSGNTERPFSVGGDTFPDFASAASRSCSNQFNSCADAANAQGNKQAGSDVTVAACTTQQTTCNSVQSKATQTNFQVLTTSDANFDYFCDA